MNPRTPKACPERKWVNKPSSFRRAPRARPLHSRTRACTYEPHRRGHTPVTSPLKKEPRTVRRTGAQDHGYSPPPSSPPLPKSACNHTNAAHDGTERFATPARGHRFSSQFYYYPFHPLPLLLNHCKHANAPFQTPLASAPPPNTSSPLPCTAHSLAADLRRATRCLTNDLPTRRCPSLRAPLPLTCAARRMPPRR
jgi:hypothetical protein